MNGPRMKTIDFGTNIEPNLVVFELLDFSNGKAALDLLIEEFEYVIIDSPPVTDAPHALALAVDVQSVILVSKPHRSRLYSIAYTSDILRQSGAHIAGAVISHSSKTMTLPSRSSEALKPPSKLEWPIHG